MQNLADYKKMFTLVFYHRPVADDFHVLDEDKNVFVPKIDYETLKEMFDKPVLSEVRERAKAHLIMTLTPLQWIKLEEVDKKHGRI